MNKLLKYSALAVFLLPMLLSCGSVIRRGDARALTCRDSIYTAIETLLDTYPQASLQDIYKSCFQDYFGPAHMITDTASVRSYIAYELAQDTAMQGAYYELCGWRGNYYRVNLSVVNDSLVSLDALTTAFCRSAPAVTPVVGDEWVAEWELIMREVRRVVHDKGHRISRMAPIVTHFAGDSAHIASLMSEGRYVLHHSELYNATYRPHYRIIRKDIFHKVIAPCIEVREK